MTGRYSNLHWRNRLKRWLRPKAEKLADFRRQVLYPPFPDTGPYKTEGAAYAALNEWCGSMNPFQYRLWSLGVKWESKKHDLRPIVIRNKVRYRVKRLMKQ